MRVHACTNGPGPYPRLPSARPFAAFRSLPRPLRRKMEAAFGVDLASVQIGESPAVAALGANALAHREKIVFAPEKFDPHSREGQRRLGHELVHVMRQRARTHEANQPVRLMQDPHLEGEAERKGAQAAAGRPVALDGVAAASKAPSDRSGDRGGIVQAQFGSWFARRFAFGSSRPLFSQTRRSYHQGFKELSAQEHLSTKSGKTYYRGVADPKFIHHVPLGSKYRGQTKAQLQDVEHYATTNREAEEHAKIPIDTGVSVSSDLGTASKYAGKEGGVQVIQFPDDFTTGQANPLQAESVVGNRIPAEWVQGVLLQAQIQKLLASQNRPTTSVLERYKHLIRK